MAAVPTIAQTLAGFVAGLDHASIPRAVRERAALHFLDSIGIALAASRLDYARRACAGLASLGGGEHVVIGMRTRLGLRDAVLMNGMLVHGLEYDDTAIRGRVHASAFCAPCALGVGAQVHASGRAVLTAYAAGLECSVRIGIGARGGFSRAGYNAVGVLGAFGSALVAGRLLGLDAAALTRAQGIALSTATGTREFTCDDSWTKRFEAGWPAASGIAAAALAQQGFRGPATAYDGKWGLFVTHLPEPAGADARAAVTASLGEAWEIERILIKLLPSCYFNHPVINSTLALVNGHDLAADGIHAIRVLVPEAAVDTVCEPRAVKLAPEDPATAQFSVYFAAAAAACLRGFPLEVYDDATLADPRIRALAQKVTWAIDPHPTFPAHYSGGVEITMADGRTFSAREDVNLGSVERPLAPGTIEDKFLANAMRAMPRESALALRETLLAIDEVDDIAAIAARLGGDG